MTPSPRTYAAQRLCSFGHARGTPPRARPLPPRPAQILSLTTEQIRNRIRILESNISIMNSEMHRLDRDRRVHDARLKDNLEKIKLNRQLPYLVSNIVEVWRVWARARVGHQRTVLPVCVWVTVPVVACGPCGPRAGAVCWPLADRVGRVCGRAAQVLDMADDEEEEAAGSGVTDSGLPRKAVVVKTTSRQVP